MTVTDESGLTMADLRRVRDELTEVAARRGARNLRVFGSVARGDAELTSDVDLLVDLAPGRSLVDLGGVVMDLQDSLALK